MSSIPYEIDYFQVGEGEKSGDAISLRFGNITGPRSEQTVVVIDGGTTDTGNEMVEHITEYYGTDTVDYVISTHPDGDHTCGLRTILEKMKVGTLLMHQPWDHVGDIKEAFADGRWTERGLGEVFERSIRFAADLRSIAEAKGVRIVEPFQGVGTDEGAIRVLGPSRDYYQTLLPDFRSTPTPKTASVFGTFADKVKEGIEWIADSFDIDLLSDDEDTTSAENNSSAIVLFDLDGHRLLFTGDAGKTALHAAADYADGIGVSLTGLKFLDVPHHGSRRNLSTSVLSRINGTTAYISASPGSSKHPSKKVVNALKKSGARVFKTNGGTICHRHNGPDRGWGALEEQPFHELVEA